MLVSPLPVSFLSLILDAMMQLQMMNELVTFPNQLHYHVIILLNDERFGLSVYILSPCQMKVDLYTS